MKISVYLKPIKGEDKEQRSNVCFRVREKAVDIKLVSELTVVDKYWDADTLSYKRTTAIDAEERKATPAHIVSIIEYVERNFDMATANSEWLKQVITDILHPIEAYERKHPNLLTRFQEYIDLFNGTKQSRAALESFARRMERYIAYHKDVLGDKNFRVYVEMLTMDDMIDFREYIANEYNLRQEHPDFYEQFGRGDYRYRQLSNTTITNIMNQYCTFLHWCKRMKYVDNDLYLQYGCKEPVYGDPFFLTIEERNKLYDADLSDKPKLARARDIFVFHCFVGCRVGDLFRMTKDNIRDGFVEYMPQKTRKCEAKTVRVPLHEKAKTILERYAPNEPKLLPFLQIGDYNALIKELLQHCGIDRMVTVLDTHGLQSTQKPLYEVASSHTARKTFIGNLYKKVPDPNLIASMSGHVEGSKAFRRYRTIDDDLKRQLVDMIN